MENIAVVKIQDEQETAGYGNGSNYQIVAGYDYMIYWNTTIAPILPILFIMGMIGIALCFIGPLYLIDKIRKRDEDGIKLGIVMSAIGFCLAIAWVWSGA